MIQAAENAALDALHFLKFCHVCDIKDHNIQKPANPSVQSQPRPSGQISGQQFFQQFRQHQVPPPRTAVPSGKKNIFERIHPNLHEGIKPILFREQNAHGNEFSA